MVTGGAVGGVTCGVGVGAGAGVACGTGVGVLLAAGVAGARYATWARLAVPPDGADGAGVLAGAVATTGVLVPSAGMWWMRTITVGGTVVGVAARVPVTPAVVPVAPVGAAAVVVACAENVVMSAKVPEAAIAEHTAFVMPAGALVRLGVRPVT